MVWYFKTTIVLSIFLLITACQTRTTLAPVVRGHYVTRTRSGHYRVKRGDTLYSIAWSFGKDYRDLAKYNRILAPYNLTPGQLLALKSYRRRTNTSSRRLKYHHAQRRLIRKTPHRKSIKKKMITQKVNLTRQQKNAFIREANLDKQRVRHWDWPTHGKVITYFNPRKGNKGINIVGRYKSPIYACAAGKVVYSGSGLPAYGKLIIIKHNARYLSAYAHNYQLLVHDGQYIKAGQEIAKMGHSGTTRTMLHFEIRRAGRPINPLIYLHKRHVA